MLVLGFMLARFQNRMLLHFALKVNGFFFLPLTAYHIHALPIVSFGKVSARFWLMQTFLLTGQRVVSCPTVVAGTCSDAEVKD